MAIAVIKILILCALPGVVLFFAVRQLPPDIRCLINLGAVFIWSVALLWAMRRQITKNLRQELNAIGQPTCMNCGYDLRTCTENRCSECGTPHHIDPTAGSQ